jgi:hypothetical protein
MAFLVWWRYCYGGYGVGVYPERRCGVQKAEASRDEEYAIVPGDEILVNDDEGNEEDD